MGKKTDIIARLEGRAHKRKKVRMAYTLNNVQPVQCTLVSDQPFFYLDEEIGLEDDFLLDEELFGEDGIFDEELESQLMAMQKKIELYDRSTKKDRQAQEERETDFADAFEGDTAIITIEELTAIIAESRMGQALLDFAQKQNIAIETSPQCDDAYFDQDARKILLHPSLDKIDAVLSVTRELRRVYQDGQKAGVNPLSLHPDYAVLINRVQQADLAVAVVRSAWELKLCGHEDIWQRVDESSMNDMGRALAREALSDFRTLNNGKAQAAAFETWFLSDRCKDADKTLINAMLSGYDKYSVTDADLKAAPIAQIIARIGEMPFGKNYLAAYASMIMQDGLFTEVRDRANANFLWFIKFERAFDETEQHLQSSGEPQILEMNLEPRNTEELRYDKSEEGRGDNVIHVAFGYSQDERNLS